VAVLSRWRVVHRRTHHRGRVRDCDKAAAAIGVSVDFFEQHVQPDLKVVRQGRKVLVPVAELGR
jgi:hypothetical protein